MELFDHVTAWKEMAELLNYYWYIAIVGTIQLSANEWVMLNRIISVHIYQPLRSGRIWHKVNF